MAGCRHLRYLHVINTKSRKRNDQLSRDDKKRSKYASKLQMDHDYDPLT